MDLNEMDQEESVQHYYGYLRAEATRYRNMEWQITAYVAAVLVFLFSFVGDSHMVSAGIGWVTKTLWTALIASIGLFGLFALNYVHRSLNRTRDDMVRLELRMGYHDPLPAIQRLIEMGYHKDGEVQTIVSKSPRRYRGFNEGVGVVFILAFMAFISIFTGMSIARIWFGW